MKYITKYGPWVAAALAVALLVYAGITIHNYRPPDEFTMATGREDGAYYKYGLEYQKLLAEKGYTLHLVSTAGSKENLRLLAEGKVDVAMVQAGTATDEHAETLSSLGSLFYEPLWIFYRLQKGDEPIHRISDLANREISIGEVDGGTHDIARFILEENGITDDNATLHSFSNAEAAQSLKDGDTDVVFMIASPESQTVMDLFLEPEIDILNIDRVLAYQSRYNEVSTITLGEGAIDLSENIPYEDKETLTTVASFVAPHNLSPDLARLLLIVAEEVNGPGGLLEKRNEFPSTKLVELPMDVAAEGYLEKGPTALDRFFPLWMASRLERLLFLIIPFMVILYPLFRITPLGVTFFFRMRINRWYRRLRKIELNVDKLTIQELDEQMAWLEELEQDLAKRLAVPMMYLADVYMLRFQVNQVNHRLERRRQLLIDGEVIPGEESPDEDELNDMPFEADENGFPQLSNTVEEPPATDDAKEANNTEMN